MEEDNAQGDTYWETFEEKTRREKCKDADEVWTELAFDGCGPSSSSGLPPQFA